jgi:starch synthase
VTGNGLLAIMIKYSDNGNNSFPQGLKVTMASPEIAPFAKSGGLSDVLGSLPLTLEQLGVHLTLIMPAYKTVLQGGFPLEDCGITFSVPVSSRRQVANLLKAEIGSNITVYFVRADRYFNRDYLYGTPQGDYADNAERFVFFARAILEVLKLNPPSILHVHEWQSALAIAFLKAQPDLYPELSPIKTVISVHNLGYQGISWHLDWHLLNLDWSFFTPRYLEFYGKINFLKGGLVFSDAITTVSPTYAEEIKTIEQGFGLEGVFRERSSSLFGILNGVDYHIWDPETDRYLERRYNMEDISGKKACKADLQRIFQLEENPDVPLLGMVSRLVSQKGFGLLLGGFDNIMAQNVQFVLLGTGDSQYEDFFRQTARRYSGRTGVKITFNETLAHKLVAGADLILMPSRYEPGGLTHLYGLKYGTIPLVRATGGLKDTVTDFNPETVTGNGFTFNKYDVSSLLAAIERAQAMYQQKDRWQTLMRNAMLEDFSWKRSAQAYLELYRKLVKGQ